MKSFVGYIADKIVKATPRSKKVAPTIKSVPPTKDIKGSVKRVYRQEESKRIDKTVASKENKIAEYLNHNLMKIDKDDFYSVDRYSITYEELPIEL